MASSPIKVNIYSHLLLWYLVTVLQDYAHRFVGAEIVDQLGDAGRVVGPGVEGQAHEPLQQGDVQLVHHGVHGAEHRPQLPRVTGQHHLRHVIHFSKLLGGWNTNGIGKVLSRRSILTQLQLVKMLVSATAPAPAQYRTTSYLQ